MSNSIFSTPAHAGEKQEKAGQEGLNAAINITLLLLKLLEQLAFEEQQKAREERQKIEVAEVEQSQLFEPGDTPFFLYGNEEYYQLEGREYSPQLEGQDPSPQLEGGGPDPRLGAADSLIGIKVGDYEMSEPISGILDRLKEMPPDKIETLRQAFASPGGQGLIREHIELSVDGEVKVSLDPPQADLAEVDIRLDTQKANNYGPQDLGLVRSEQTLLDLQVTNAESTVHLAFEKCFEGPGPHVIEGAQYTLKSEEGVLTVEAKDGRGEILSSKNGDIKTAKLLPADVGRFEAGSKIMREHQGGLMQQMDPVVDVEPGKMEEGGLGEIQIASTPEIELD